MKYLDSGKVCGDFNSSAENFYKLLNFTRQDLDQSGCRPACNESDIILSVTHFHNNSVIDPLNTFKAKELYTISVFYIMTDVEERRTVLLFDVWTMISSAGGNLGLALGYSALSILLGLVDPLAGLVGKYSQRPGPKKLAEANSK